MILLLFNTSVGETRIVFSKLEGPLPTPLPITIEESAEAEPQTAASIGETITLKKAEDNDLSVDKDKSSPKKEPSAEVLPSESWVIVKPQEVDQSVTDKPNKNLAGKTEGIPDQPATSNTEPPASDQEVNKQAWSGSGDERGSASVAQPPPIAPSSSSVSGGGAGPKDIEVEDIEEREVKENGVVEAVSNAVFTFGEEEEEEPEEKFSTPSAATPQVNRDYLLQAN